MTDQEMMRWAVIENCRYWKLVDSEMVTKNAEQNHRLHLDDILLIFWEYSTGRGAFESGKCLSSATRLAAFINQKKSKFEKAKGLQAKAKVCANMVKLAHSKGITTNRQSVSMTKLLWFACPSGWTMYDGNAAKVVGKLGNSVSVDRMLKFYDRLGDIGFPHAAERINGHMKNTIFAQQHGERVLDKFLWMKGSKAPHKTIELCRQFLVDLPERDALVALACNVAKDPEAMLDFGANH